MSFYTPSVSDDSIKKAETHKGELIKIYGMTPTIVGLLNKEGITTFQDLIDTDSNRIIGLIAPKVVLTQSFLKLIFDTWQEQAYLGVKKDWKALARKQKDLAVAFPKKSLSLPSM